MSRRDVLFAAALAALALAGCGTRRDEQVTAPRSILLVTIDTLRWDHVTPERAPALARLQAESTTFTQAVSVGPVTLPAHASLLTGLYPPAHGVRDNNLYTLPESVPTFTKALKANGYATAAFVSAIVLDKRFGLAQGFDVYDDAVGDIERPAAETVDRARAWLAAVNGPFFLWVHLFEPHAPYKSGSYGEEVRIADRETSRLFDGLRARGLWDSTVVSVTADHGEALGDHGEQTHGFFLYDPTLRIPWLLRVPGRAAATFAHQVRIVDVLPTTMALAGVTANNDDRRSDGVVMTPFLDSGRSPDLEAWCETYLPRHQFGWSELTGLRRERLKLVNAPLPELYDLVSDPGERTNVFDGRQADASSMTRALTAIERVTSASARLAGTDPLRSERFMSLGYIGYSPPVPAQPQGRLANPREKLPIYLAVMNAIELSAGGDAEGALAAADRAIALDPAVAQAHFLRGTLLGQRGRFKEAAAALERTVAINPRFGIARFKLALAYLQLGKPAQAERELQSVIDHEPDNFRAWHNLAAIAYTRGDLARAEELERRAVAIEPDYVEALNTLGAIAIVEKRTAEAVSTLSRASQLAPANGQVLANLALALEQAGRPDDARQASERACRADRRYCAP